MGILVGGSGSSGTTVLRSYLNRHPEIFSGAELNFLNKEMFFRSWEEQKHLLLKKNHRGVSTNGWFPYPGTNILHPDYGWRRETLEEIVRLSRSIAEFSDTYFSPSIERTGARFWIEKTPSNAYCFPHFLDAFPNGKVVHVIRNPYDTVASLVKRGMSEYFAAGIWVYNNSAALRAKNSTKYFQISYEGLVRNPDEEFAELFKFLDVKVLSQKELASFPSEEDEAERKTSWKSSPSAEITTKSLGGFSKLDRHSQERIRAALSAFVIPRRIGDAQHLSQLNCEQLCEVFGYDFEVSSNRGTSWLTAQLCRDVAVRTIKGYKTMPPNYPGGLKLFSR